ncbi:hypothetical protein J6590_010237 [Homalodisca vitripennis]|nr:hypothetical protein J6590_010237 [Homalodisca vitripennis]
MESRYSTRALRGPPAWTDHTPRRERVGQSRAVPTNTEHTADRNAPYAHHLTFCQVSLEPNVRALSELLGFVQPYVRFLSVLFGSAPLLISEVYDQSMQVALEELVIQYKIDGNDKKCNGHIQDLKP